VDGVFTGVEFVGVLLDDCVVISPSTPDPAIFQNNHISNLASKIINNTFKIRLTFFVMDVTAQPAQLSATLAAAPATLPATVKDDDEFSVEFGSGIAVSGYKYK